MARSMPRIDHAAFETADPPATAAFYERVLGARIVKAEGHPVMAYLEPDGPGPHVAVRVTDEEREAIKQRLDADGIEWRERDHGIALGLFFEDPDGRLLEAITYRSGDDPRRP